MASLITSLPPWALFLLIFIIGVLAAFLGGLVQRRQEKNETAKKAGDSPSFLGAALGLLAFMLGITFSITAARFSDRRHLLVSQANAIGTCYLRTSLLPDPQKRETQRLFREYIDLLAGITRSTNPNRDLTRLDALQMQLWHQAVSLKQETMDPIFRSLYITSLNEMIDLFGERKTFVFMFKIPDTIWASLLLLYIFCMFIAGLETGPFRVKQNIKVPLVTAAFALIVVLTSAMDSSTKPGIFTLNQQPILDVQTMIRDTIFHKL